MASATHSSQDTRHGADTPKVTTRAKPAEKPRENDRVAPPKRPAPSPIADWASI